MCEIVQVELESESVAGEFAFLAFGRGDGVRAVFLVPGMGSGGRDDG
jgi:hypothetical protein